MNTINEQKQFIDPNLLNRLYKLTHPELDATMQRLKQKIIQQFQAFRQRLVGSLNHINYFRYMRAFPSDDIKFIFRQRVNVSKTQSRFQQKQQIMQRMNNFQLIKLDYSGVADNCIYQIQEYLTEQQTVIDFKKICPSGSTFININKDMIQSIVPYWDNSPDQMDLTTLLKQASPNFPKQQIKKLGSIFSQADQKVISARLIFRASEHNFLSASFKDNCAGRAPTLMLAKSDKGYIFGGFTRCRWIKTKEKQYVSDPTCTSFLFSLSKNQVFKLKQNQKDYAISAYGGWGPIYGSPYGPDLSLADKCHINDHSCSSLGSHYDIPANIKQYSNQAFSLLAGSKKFKVIEYEVYELLMEE